MKKKECPSCAMEIEDDSNVCPICGYEFSGHSSLWKWVAAMLLALTLLFLLIEVFSKN